MTEKEMREIEMQEIGKRLEKIGPKLNGSLTEKELINLVKELERLKEKYKETKVEEGIIIAYARASANLTAYQDLKRREQSVEKLRKLKKAYQGEASEEKIAVAYAWALGNLTAEQDLEGREESVEKLRELKEDCRGKKFEERAVIFYAMWLVNLTAEQDLKGAEKSVEKLKELKETYQGEGSEEEIVKKYAQALANLTMKQDLKGVKESAEKLKGLMKEYEEKEAVEKEIVIYYAVVLDCLINKELEKSESDYQELIEVLRRGNWKILKSFLEKVNIKKEEDKKSFIHALIIYFSYHKIMEKLIFMENKAKLSHYTSMKVLPKLIKPKEENKDSSDNTKTPVRLRCYNVAYMNDPEEGKCLYDYLRQIPKQDREQKQEQEQQKKWLTENIFSLETENKYGVYFFQLNKS